MTAAEARTIPCPKCGRGVADVHGDALPWRNMESAPRYETIWLLLKDGHVTKGRYVHGFAESDPCWKTDDAGWVYDPLMWRPLTEGDNDAARCAPGARHPPRTSRGWYRHQAEAAADVFRYRLGWALHSAVDVRGEARAVVHYARLALGCDCDMGEHPNR